MRGLIDGRCAKAKASRSAVSRAVNIFFIFQWFKQVLEYAWPTVGGCDFDTIEKVLPYKQPAAKLQGCPSSLAVLGIWRAAETFAGGSVSLHFFRLRRRACR